MKTFLLVAFVPTVNIKQSFALKRLFWVIAPKRKTYWVVKSSQPADFSEAWIRFLVTRLSSKDFLALLPKISFVSWLNPTCKSSFKCHLDGFSILWTLVLFPGCCLKCLQPSSWRGIYCIYLQILLCDKHTSILTCLEEFGPKFEKSLQHVGICGLNESL